MMRVLMMIVGVALVAAGAGWFFTPLLDAPIASIAAQLPGGATGPDPKFAFDRPMNIAVASLAVLGLALLIWSLVPGRSRAART